MNKQFAKLGVAVGSLAAAGGAFAQAAAGSAEAALGTLTGSTAAYGPIMYGLAIAAVGIMVGVKWIKRARGAA